MSFNFQFILDAIKLLRKKKLKIKFTNQECTVSPTNKVHVAFNCVITNTFDTDIIIDKIELSTAKKKTLVGEIYLDEQIVPTPSLYFPVGAVKSIFVSFPLFSSDFISNHRVRENFNILFHTSDKTDLRPRLFNKTNHSQKEKEVNR